MTKSNKGDVSTTFQLNLTPLWHRTKGDPKISIAVLDGPIDLSHTCFDGSNLRVIKSLASGNASGGIALEHGTHIASLIFGQHDSPVKGISPGCSGLFLPIFSNGPTGSLTPCSQLDLSRAVTQAVENGANIINISGGQLTQSGQADPLLVRAIELCAESNVLVIAAAGNDGCQCLHLPAAMPMVLAVGAMDIQGIPLDFSNWGDTYQQQGILAPGQDLLGAVPGGGTKLKSGTSFATSIVSGIAGLLLSIQVKHGLSPDPIDIRRVILESVTTCDNLAAKDCRRFLRGSLDSDSLQKMMNHERLMPDLNHNSSNTDSENQPPSNQPVRLDNSNISAELEEIILSEAAVNTDQLLTRTSSIGEHTSPHLGSISPSEGCGCGGGTTAQKVFAIGELDFDFGTEARLDYFAQNIFPSNPTRAISKSALVDFINNTTNQTDAVARPWEAQAVTWTLKLDATVIYAIAPSGPFANIVYQRLVSALGDDKVERVSIPGYIGGNVRLMSGQIVPAIVPDVRGIYSWSTSELLKSLTDLAAPNSSTEKASENIFDYLNRVYYQYRNLGVTPQERALNFSATNAFSSSIIMSRGTSEDKVLDTIEVEKSPICRPESDCYDVKLIFFDPENERRARSVFRFTVDVSDVIPVLVGPVRQWSMR